MKVKILRNTQASGRDVAAGGVELVSDQEARDLVAAGKARYLDGGDKKPSVDQLRGLHAGRPIAVLGGGPSMPGDLEKIAHLNPVLIGVNHHAILHGYPCEFMVFFDNPYRLSCLAKAAQSVPVVITPYGDFATHVLDITYTNYGMTSWLGVWLAELLGASIILLCGMDCYSGKTPYFYPTKSEYAITIKDQLDFWKNVFGKSTANIKSISGPLLNVFEPYVAKGTADAI